MPTSWKFSIVLIKFLLHVKLMVFHTASSLGLVSPLQQTNQLRNESESTIRSAWAPRLEYHSSLCKNERALSNSKQALLEVIFNPLIVILLQDPSQLWSAARLLIVQKSRGGSQTSFECSRFSSFLLLQSLLLSWQRRSLSLLSLHVIIVNDSVYSQCKCGSLEEYARNSSFRS